MTYDHKMTTEWEVQRKVAHLASIVQRDKAYPEYGDGVEELIIAKVAQLVDGIAEALGMDVELVNTYLEAALVRENLSARVTAAKLLDAWENSSSR